jgi:hypothetical protein
VVMGVLSCDSSDPPLSGGGVGGRTTYWCPAVQLASVGARPGS